MNVLFTNVSAITAMTAAVDVDMAMTAITHMIPARIEVRRDHDLPPVVPVGDRTSERLEQDVGHQPNDRGDTDPRSRPGRVEDVDDARGRVEPVPVSDTARLESSKR